MNEKQDFRENEFLLLPLPLVREVFMPRHFVEAVIYYGIYDASMRLYSGKDWRYQNPEFEYVFISDVIYCFYNDKEKLTGFLLERLGYLDKNEVIIEDRRGFDDDGFYDPSNFAVTDLAEYLINENDTLLAEKIAEWGKIHQVIRRFHLVCNVSDVIRWYEELHSDFTGEPICAVGLSFLIRQCERIGNMKSTRKIEYGRMSLAMLLGCSSIIGMKRSWCDTTKEMILCRTFGCKSPAELAKFLKANKRAKEIYEKFSTRKRFEQLRRNLLESGLMGCFFGYARRTYISISKPFAEISQAIAEKHRKSLLYDEQKRQREVLHNLIHQKGTSLRKGVQL